MFLGKNNQINILFCQLQRTMCACVCVRARTAAGLIDINQHDNTMYDVRSTVALERNVKTNVNKSPIDLSSFLVRTSLTYIIL